MNLPKFLFNKIKGLISVCLKIFKSRAARQFYNNKKPVLENLTENISGKENLVIITIAFNDAEIIKKQHYYLKKYLKEEFCYIVADNSGIKNDSNLIYQYCVLNKMFYVKLPPTPFPKDPSLSHGQAIDWSYQNIIKKTHPVFFGFIDHDVLPFKETKITPYINNDGLFGPIRENGKKWFLWAGFCFYEYDKVKKYKLNFLPHYGLNIGGLSYLDTGGSNYYKIYRKVDRNSLFTIWRMYLDLKTGKAINNEENMGTTIEVMGDWIHLIRTSSWDKKDNRKLYSLEEIMNIVNKYFALNKKG